MLGGIAASMAAEPVVIHVAADGPVPTLAAARDRVRAIVRTSGPHHRKIVVSIQPGTYRLDAPLELGPADSGAPGSPIIYRAEPGGEVRITGGRVVNGFRPVEDHAVRSRLPVMARDHVVVADLFDQGIDANDIGYLSRRGFPPARVVAHMEVFAGGRPLPLARWPNHGYVRLAAVPESGDGLSFAYPGDRPRRWSAAEEPWAFGYWSRDWAASYAPITRIDVDRRVATLAPPAPRPLRPFRQGQRFYFVNVLAELDRPGEWYVDRTSGRLYLWPPDRARAATVEVNVLPTLIRLSGARHVRFEGLTLDLARDTAMVIEKGLDVRFHRCVVRNIGGVGVRVGGTDSGVSRCRIENTGDAGVVLAGGDRQTLVPGGLFVEDSWLARTGRWSRTYHPPVRVEGVGNRVVHNEIQAVPHVAILFSGNEHRIAGNLIRDVGREAGGIGIIYTGRDWTARGTVIQGNVVQGVHGFGPVGAFAIHLDDQASGTRIRGNLFNDVHQCVVVGGGRHNVVVGNLFAGCGLALRVDARGLLRSIHDADLARRLASVPYRSAVWTRRYPGLANILAEDPHAPLGNVIRDNVSVGGTWVDVSSRAEPYFDLTENMGGRDPRFRSPAWQRRRAPMSAFALKPGSPARAVWPLDPETVGPRLPAP